MRPLPSAQTAQAGRRPNGSCTVCTIQTPASISIPPVRANRTICSVWAGKMKASADIPMTARAYRSIVCITRTQKAPDRITTRPTSTNAITWPLTAGTPKASAGTAFTSSVQANPKHSKIQCRNGGFARETSKDPGADPFFCVLTCRQAIVHPKIEKAEPRQTKARQTREPAGQSVNSAESRQDNAPVRSRADHTKKPAATGRQADFQPG